MKNTAIVTVALMGVFLCTGAALAQKLPRHLVYKVGVTVMTQTEELTSGEGMAGAAPGSNSTVSASSGVAHYNGGMLSHGTITADVLSITADNALAIQISEDTDNRKAPPVKVYVMPDGQLVVPGGDATNITPEENTLLQMLGRSFVSDDDISAGKWVHEVNQKDANVHETYQITGTQPNGDLSISLDQRVKLGGAQPSDTTTHGTVTYSNKFKVPRSVTLDGRTHHEGIQQTQTEDTKVNFDLLSDSFQTAGL
ncbi:MAG: hypothetical protein JO233_00140 [Candidatus Eremiobacteraeota bacterium]|nr:hypothetical protein [Candidatus Eremiobacteraeota bacterium]